MMTTKPAWLPDMFPVNPWTEQTFDLLYAIFRRDFIESQPCYRGCTVWFFPEKAADKELVFWHLTSRDDKETGERLPDLRRSERLPWARPMLDNADKLEILDWDYEEGDGTIKTYVWLKDNDYLTILKKYPDGRRRLITSFWIDYQNTRRKLEKKYENRIR
jgi:hypothetical protein